FQPGSHLVWLGREAQNRRRPRNRRCYHHWIFWVSDRAASYWNSSFLLRPAGSAVAGYCFWINHRKQRPPCGCRSIKSSPWWPLVGSHLRGDRFCGGVERSARAILTVRSEIGPNAGVPEYTAGSLHKSQSHRLL